jgi:adenylate cyclase class 2
LLATPATSTTAQGIILNSTFVILHSSFAKGAMSLEVETKLRVASHDPVRDRLRELGATLQGAGLETNWIFDRPDGSLRARGIGMRIRSMEREAGEDPASTLTVKGPVQAGPMKSREELEISVSNADTARALLEMIDLTLILGYQKRRESWTLGQCRIELDEPPRIGRFVEIEGPNVEAIRDVQNQLGLGDEPHVRDSYVRMLLEHCSQHAISPLHLTLP